jgi:hypothetical protein
MRRRTDGRGNLVLEIEANKPDGKFGEAAVLDTPECDL